MSVFAFGFLTLAIGMMIGALIAITLPWWVPVLISIVTGYWLRGWTNNAEWKS